MPVKGIKDIKTAHDLKGVHSLKGLSQLQGGLKEAGETLQRKMQTLQANLQTGVNRFHDKVGHQTEKTSQRLKKGGGMVMTDSKREVSPETQEQYKLVRHCLEQSLAIDEELQDKNGMAADLEILTDVALNEGDYGAAEQYLERAVHVLTEEGKQKQASEALFNAGKKIYGQLQEQASTGEGKEAKGEAEDKGKKAERLMMNTVSERVKEHTSPRVP